ncbi:MAG TPA: GNAT family N-acetyltransferase [bacterium]
MSPTFRRFTRADIPTVLRLVKAYHAYDKIPHNEAYTRAALEFLLRYPLRGGVWIIRVGKAVAGYVCLTPCFSLEFHGELFIDELFFLPKFRGQGLGQAALEFAAAWARENGITAVHVISEKENPAARRAYRKGGFGGAHRFLMTRLVDPPTHLRG